MFCMFSIVVCMLFISECTCCNELTPSSDFEDLDTECKAVLNPDESHIEGWAKSISAFSNSGGGHLYVGVSDDMEAFGLSRSDVDATKRLVLLTIDRHVFPHAKVYFTEIPLRDGKFVLDIGRNRNRRIQRKVER